MKSCEYCGRENADESVHCLECGTFLEPTDASDQTAPAPVERRLDARYATLILFLFLGVQIGAAIITGIAALSIVGVRGEDSDRDRLIRTITPPAIALAVIAGGVAMLLTARSQIRRHLSDTSPTGAAWVLGSSKRIVQGLGIGALTGCGYALLVMNVKHRGPALGPFGRMAVTPGLPQLTWLLIGVVLAPVFEELLFRGMLYAGYRNSFGPVRAAVLTTSIFVLLHLPETMNFLPAIAGITAMAIAALWIRLRSSAIGPAVAVHFGYNATLAMILLWSLTWRR